MSANQDQVRRLFESLLVEARATQSQFPTVSSVAKAAGISRSSMYRFHAGVVTQIQSLTGDQNARRRDQLRVKAQLLAQQLKAEKELTKALAKVCAELAAEKVALSEQLEEERLRFTLRLEGLQKKLRGVSP